MGVNLQIYGKKFAIESDVSAEYMNEVTQYVDSKFNELKGASESPFDIAVLVALNIADELFQKRELTKRIVDILEKELFDI